MSRLGKDVRDIQTWTPGLGEAVNRTDETKSQSILFQFDFNIVD